MFKVQHENFSIISIPQYIAVLKNKFILHLVFRVTNNIYCSLLIFLLFTPGIKYATDIENVSKAKPVKIIGGVGTDQYSIIPMV